MEIIGVGGAAAGVEARKIRDSWLRRIQSLIVHVLRTLARPWLPGASFPRRPLTDEEEDLLSL
ncbi:hypothetical protein ACP70R_027183 [Stipagrostis hirtigluma subsp. patula]